MLVYNEYEACTPEGLDLSEKIDKALSPILHEHMAKGGTTNDFVSLAALVLINITCEERLIRAMKKRKHEALKGLKDTPAN